MPKGIYKRTEYHRKNWFKEGHYSSHTSEGDLKIKKALKGRNFGNKFQKGYKMSADQIKKMSKAREGKGNPMWGKKMEESGNWQGGISFEPYSVDWTKTLKRSIRERDRYTCQACGELQSDKAFDCHHIDYDKKNCNPDNLITLCRKCHMKTNFNRNYWINYFRR
jgi:hypothetical protein